MSIRDLLSRRGPSLNTANSVLQVFVLLIHSLWPAKHNQLPSFPLTISVNSNEDVPCWAGRIFQLQHRLLGLPKGLPSQNREYKEYKSHTDITGCLILLRNPSTVDLLRSESTNFALASTDMGRITPDPHTPPKKKCSPEPPRQVSSWPIQYQ